MIPFTACVMTYNEEQNLPACLESVRWAPEILVVDSGSKDRTVEIAKSFGAKVLHRPFTNFAEQRKFLFESATNRWVFYIDADERFTPELQKEIQEAFAGAEPDCAGFTMPRLSYFMGRPIRHCGWYPDRVIRAFDRTLYYNSRERVHGKMLVKGSVWHMKHDILHYPYKDLTHHMAKMNSYTSESAQGKFSEGKRVNLLEVALVGPWRFLKMYFFQLGILDGKAGFILSLLSAFGDSMKYLKLYEISQTGGSR